MAHKYEIIDINRNLYLIERSKCSANMREITFHNPNTNGAKNV